MKTLIIAEAGVNHNGDINLAYQLVDAAADAKVDVIKFQTFSTELIVTKDSKKAAYQNQNDSSTKTQFEMLKKLEFTLKDFLNIEQYCIKKKILFASTPFDLESIDLLAINFDMPFWKIPSGEITNLPYLRKIGALNQKIIISTGMANLEEIKAALTILTDSGTDKNKITILHANTMYPTPMQDVNLKAMLTIGKKFDVDFGYSDHTLGIEIDIAAVALGATTIEKHFTLDKSMSGPDHKASLDPSELKKMVQAIRNIELALGDGRKVPMPSEIENKLATRKSIIAKIDILAGDKFSDNNLTIKRPGSGISPMEWDNLIGITAPRNFKKDEIILI